MKTTNEREKKEDETTTTKTTSDNGINPKNESTNEQTTDKQRTQFNVRATETLDANETTSVRLDAASRQHETQRAWRHVENVLAEHFSGFFFFGRPLILWNFCFEVHFFCCSWFRWLLGSFVGAATSITFHTTRLSLFFIAFFFSLLVRRARALASAEAVRRKIGEWVAINARTREDRDKEWESVDRRCHCHRRKHQKPFQLKEKTTARPLAVRVSRFSCDKSMWTLLSGSQRKVKYHKSRSINASLRRGMKFIYQFNLQSESVSGFRTLAFYRKWFYRIQSRAHEDTATALTDRVDRRLERRGCGGFFFHSSHTSHSRTCQAWSITHTTIEILCVHTVWP